MSEHKRDIGATLLAGAVCALVGSIVFCAMASRVGEVSPWHPICGMAVGFALGIGLAKEDYR